MALPAEKEQYTFADILTRAEDDRIELIDGEAYMMAPPSRIHPKVSFEIGRQIGNYLEGKKCEVYQAPFGVRLFEKDGDAPGDVSTMVEPETQTVQVYMLENGIFQPIAFYGPGDVAKVNVLEGCFVELGKVFTE